MSLCPGVFACLFFSKFCHPVLQNVCGGLHQQMNRMESINLLLTKEGFLSQNSCEIFCKGNLCSADCMRCNFSKKGKALAFLTLRRCPIIFEYVK